LTIYQGFTAKMRGPKLSASERDGIKARIAAGDHHADIAAAFGCTIDNVHYYAKKIKPQIQAATIARESAVIDRGLSAVDARVAQLEWLNALLHEDLATGLYGTDIKLTSTGKVVEVPVFKAQQLAQLRGTLDDIAKERGGRKTVAEVMGKDGDPISFSLTFDRATAGDDAADDGEIHAPLDVSRTAGRDLLS
jgi:hypothetical protein